MKLTYYLEYIFNATNFEIRKSDISGKGVFAAKSFKKGDFINIHFFKNDNELAITKFGRYLNHSYDPSAISKKVSSGYNTFAIKDIEKGEEITLDYTVNKELEQPEYF